MHSLSEVGPNVPAFLGKLWKMVEDPVNNDLISWTVSGTSFTIKDEIRFARELLPMYYKHNNMASFIRQLNMYGFHKIVSMEAGSMKMECPEEIQFSHPFFIQGHPYLLENIKRKMTVNKVVTSDEKVPPHVFTKVLSDVRQMKSRQENIDSRLEEMKVENSTLWRELSILRQKHAKQQQMVNKLIRFLVSLMNQNPKMFSPKGKYPMLQENLLTKVPSNDVSDREAASPAGPTIHELNSADDLLDAETEEAAELVNDLPISPSNATDHFLDQYNEVIEDGIVDTLFTTIESNDKIETIIGTPEDTLIVNPNLKKQNNLSRNKPRIIQLSGNIQIPKEIPTVRPNYSIKIVTNPKIDIDVQKQIKESQLKAMKKQEETKQYLQKQIKMNHEKIQRNKAQIDRSEEFKNNQQKIINNQQEKLSNNQEILNQNQTIINSILQMNNIQRKTNQSNTKIDQQQSKRRQQTKRNVKPILQKETLSKQLNNPEVVTIVVTPEISNSSSLLQSNPIHQQGKAIQQQNVKMNRNQRKLMQIKPKHQGVPLSQNQLHINSNLIQQHTQTSPQRQQVYSPTKPQIEKSPIGLQHNQIDPPKSPFELLQQDNLNQGLTTNSIQTQVTPEVTVFADNNNFDNSGIDDAILDIVDGGCIDFDEGPATNLDMPVVEVPPLETPQEQSSTVAQDVLLGSPIGMADPLLTSQDPHSPGPSNMQVACLDSTAYPNTIISNELGNHLDAMQADLDSLKEMLRSEGISLDANALLGCFNEDPLSYNISDPVPCEDPNKPRENNGNQLMTYTPPLIDLSDLMGSDWVWSPGPTATEDSYSEINTPQFEPDSPSFSSSKRQKI